MTESSSPSVLPETDDWPVVEYDSWKDSYATLHRWTQIVGKIRMAKTPSINHWWHAVLYVTSGGLTTSPIPHGLHYFQIDFDFLAHQLVLTTSRGDTRSMALAPRSVADFYGNLMRLLDELGMPVLIEKRPNELADATPFDVDHDHAAYDARQVALWWRALVQADRVLKLFRSRFAGKSSPSHFFWGSFDLAATRFSGRTAPRHPGGVPNCPDHVMHEAYSHELSSCGFWPGNANLPYPLFYAYAYPVPAGFESAIIDVPGASFNATMQEFVLRYDDVRRSASPDDLVLAFFQGTYEAAARLGKWDRSALEASSR